MTSPSGIRPPDHDYEVSDPTALPKAPVVSVLMLAYNHDRYLAQAIDSVLAQQTGFPIELLIGEDCSMDRTREIALRYQATYPTIIRVISSHNNVGMQQNSRRLIEASRGKFIAFCEGDDYWTDVLKLQIQVDYLRSHIDSGAVHSDFDHILSRGSHWLKLSHFQRHTRGSVQSGDIFPTLLTGNFIQTCTLCVRANLAHAYLTSGLPVDSYPVGDWPLCLYISAQTKVDYQNLSLAAYRKNPGSITNSGDSSRLLLATKCKAIIDDMCAFFRVSPITQCNALSAHHYTLLKLAFLANDSVAFDRSRVWLEGSVPRSHKYQLRLLHWVIRHGAAYVIFVRLMAARRRLHQIVWYRNIVGNSKSKPNDTPKNNKGRHTNIGET